ncbi:MAG: hypothetical protein KAJ23_16925 [Maribacter sp.]|nr:hypothetical protein [Maribacter sp.]
MRKIKNIFLAIVSIVLVSSCSQERGSLIYMNDLKKKISKDYRTEQIEINITNKNLTVSLLDSKFENYGSIKKQGIAREIGQLAKDIKEDGPKLESGVVKFINTSNYIIARTSKSESYNMY